MLLGVGGSGKQTLARFAAFVAEARCFSIVTGRGYGPPEFREDLKQLFRCGQPNTRSSNDSVQAARGYTETYCYSRPWDVNVDLEQL